MESGRFATSRFAANKSRFAAHVKSIRFSEVVSLQSRFATELNSRKIQTSF